MCSLSLSLDLRQELVLGLLDLGSSLLQRKLFGVPPLLLYFLLGLLFSLWILPDGSVSVAVHSLHLKDNELEMLG